MTLWNGFKELSFSFLALLEELTQMGQSLSELDACSEYCGWCLVHQYAETFAPCARRTSLPWPCRWPVHIYYMCIYIYFNVCNIFICIYIYILFWKSVWLTARTRLPVLLKGWAVGIAGSLSLLEIYFVRWACPILQLKGHLTHQLPT